MQGKHRAILLLLAVIAAIAAVIIVPSLGSDEADDPDVTGTQTQTQTQPSGATTATPGQPEPTRPSTAKTVTLRGGKPAGGVKRIVYKKGQIVNIVVMSDQADDVHVHGYDVEKPVPAGGSARLRFEADADGIYEIELHSTGEKIAELRVNP